MKERINAIIQARMGSTRLPGKILLEIEDKPILGHVIERLRSVKDIEDIIVATSILHDDDAVEAYCKANNINYVRGSEENVLERFGLAVKKYPSDLYIRATADNPMIDVELVSSMIAFFEKMDLTYACYKNFPIGSGVEIFTDHALQEALSNANVEYEFEHVTPYMYQRMENRKVQYFTSPVDDSKIRMTVDTAEDLKFAVEMFKRLYKINHLFGIKDIKRELKNDLYLAGINDKVHQKKLGE